MEEVEQVKFLLSFIKTGIRVLSYRMAMNLALISSFVLFLWTMVAPDVWRLGSSVAFTILVYLPIVWQESRSKGE